MKILFINLPYLGHVVPTIGLVQELIRQGCQVTYLLPHDWQDRIAGSGASFHGYPNHPQLAEQMKNAWDAAEAIIDDFDLVIYEQFFFLGKHLAEKHQKGAVRVFTAPATNQELMAQFIHAKGPMSIFRHRWLSKAFTKDIARGIPMKTDNWLDEIVENPPELNLVYTLPDFQPCREDFPEPGFLFLGPSVYPRSVPDFDFAKRRPLVYVSLGTILKGSVSFFRNCVDAFRGEEWDVILSVGHKFPVRRLRNVPDNVHIYPSVPQVEVLKMADVFVTHGGMNSVSEALAAGTPMLVIPQVSDQPVSARCVERLGVGKQLAYAKADAPTLRAAVLSLAADEKIRAGLETVRQQIARAPGNKGGAEAVIRYYEQTKRSVL